jgi:hypothetical protein
MSDDSQLELIFCGAHSHTVGYTIRGKLMQKETLRMHSPRLSNESSDVLVADGHFAIASRCKKALYAAVSNVSISSSEDFLLPRHAKYRALKRDLSTDLRYQGGPIRRRDGSSCKSRKAEATPPHISLGRW